MDKTWALVGRPDSVWAQKLTEILGLTLPEAIMAEEAVAAKISETAYNLLVLDVAAVNHAGQLVRWLRARAPQLPVIVVTQVPLWQEARELLRAGAVDYLSPNLGRRELEIALREVPAPEELKK